MCEGGCFCGAVRYRVTADPVVVCHCHCLHCRRTSGAPFLTWAEFRSSQFMFTRGKPRYVRTRPEVTRSFCPRCGTPLTYQRDDAPQSVDVTACSLDDPAAVRPRDHLYCERMLPWIHLDDSLPKYPTRRSGM